MKRIALFVLLVVIGIGALVQSFRARPLAVPPAAPPELLAASPPAGMRLSILAAGRMRSVAGLAYRGGGFDDERVFGMDAVLIEHPAGNILIDAGFGRDVAAHFASNPAPVRWMGGYETEVPVADQLGEAASRLQAVILTHAHWDHVSGLADLPGVPVWVTAAERRFIASWHPAAKLARSLDGVDWQVYDFPHGPYLGFARSRDVHGDGSLVLVPAAGHTPGGVIVFVHLPDGSRYALVGDLVWQAEGIALPAERPWLVRTLVDVDAGGVRDLVVHMHRLQQQIPGLVVLPSHDRRLMATLPAYAGPAPDPTDIALPPDG